MIGCIIGPKVRSDCEIWLLEEGKKIFDKFFYAPMTSIVISNDKVFYKDKDLSELDFVLPRIPRTYAWFGYKILKILESKVYMPIDPRSVVVAHNKFLTLLALKEAGLPVPETYMAASRSTVENLLDEMNYPVVIKLLYGSLGKGVMFADSKQSAMSFMDTLERFKEPIFLEEYVPNAGEDIRAFVLGKSVLGAERRIAKSDELRTNIGIGGIGKPIVLGKKMEELAVKAAGVLGMGITGVDIIKGPDGPVILEANVNVHFEGLAKVLGVNIARKVVEFVKSEAAGASAGHFPGVGMIADWFKKPRLHEV
jgi:ribosomal protein S6--L-glutamate ligase